MDGFQEVDFTVVSEYQLSADTANIVVQLRETKPEIAEARHAWKYHPRYISFWAPAPAVNFHEISLMFLYATDAGELPTHDWEKLRACSSTPFDDLGWIERVHNRVQGLRKDGSVIEYTGAVAQS